MFSLHTVFCLSLIPSPLVILLSPFPLSFSCNFFCAPSLYTFYHFVSHRLPSSCPKCLIYSLALFFLISLSFNLLLPTSLPHFSSPLISTDSLVDSVQSSCFLSSLKTLKINVDCGGDECEGKSEADAGYTAVFSSIPCVILCERTVCVCVPA